MFLLGGKDLPSKWDQLLQASQKSPKKRDRTIPDKIATISFSQIIEIRFFGPRN